MSEMIIPVLPRRMKETALWVLENLEPHQYPGIDHWPHDPEMSKVEIVEKWEWEEMSWFDHIDTTVTQTRRMQDGIERTPRRFHLVFTDPDAFFMLKLLQ